MWKVLGMISLMVLCIIPGAILGAVCGAFFLPVKIWALFGESSNYQDSHNYANSAEIGGILCAPNQVGTSGAATLAPPS